MKAYHSVGLVARVESNRLRATAISRWRGEDDYAGGASSGLLGTQTEVIIDSTTSPL